MTDIITYIRNSLQSIYSPSEINEYIRTIMEDICNIPSHHYLLGTGRALTEDETRKIHEVVERLKQKEPIQYIIGFTPFYGLQFEVNPATLIPRPETSELIEWIIQSEQRPDLSILDIGTGSGCIAISLAKQLKEASVTAIDISQEALLTAFRNAQRNNVSVCFGKVDILNTEEAERCLPESFDLIVSNPPYIKESEKTDMEKNVLAFEPHTALFVPDNDPLLFYRQIARFGQNHLKTDGTLYFEINREHGTETTEMLQAFGYKNISCKKDISGNDRMIKASR